MLALAARRSIQAFPGGVLQPPLMRTTAYGLFVFLPVGIFLVHVYPAWSWMYLIDPSEHTPLVSFSAVLAYPVCCVAGYLLTERALRQGRAAVAYAVAAVGAAGATAATVVPLDRLTLMGSYKEWELGVARRVWHHGPWMWDMVLVGMVTVGAFLLVLRANRRESALA